MKDMLPTIVGFLCYPLSSDPDSEMLPAFLKIKKEEKKFTQFLVLSTSLCLGQKRQKGGKVSEKQCQN